MEDQLGKSSINLGKGENDQNLDKYRSLCQEYLNKKK